jgi:hypothetical protein
MRGGAGGGLACAMAWAERGTEWGMSQVYTSKTLDASKPVE